MNVQTPEPFDDVAAGIQLKMILISIPMYWLIIALIDSGLLYYIAKFLPFYKVGPCVLDDDMLRDPDITQE